MNDLHPIAKLLVQALLLAAGSGGLVAVRDQFAAPTIEQVQCADIVRSTILWCEQRTKEAGE